MGLVSIEREETDAGSKEQDPAYTVAIRTRRV